MAPLPLPLLLCSPGAPCEQPAAPRQPPRHHVNGFVRLPRVAWRRTTPFTANNYSRLCGLGSASGETPHHAPSCQVQQSQ